MSAAPPRVGLTQALGGTKPRRSRMAWFMGMVGISISILVLGKLEEIHKDIKALKEQDKQ
jgi:hypothetical protein